MFVLYLAIIQSIQNVLHVCPLLNHYSINTKWRWKISSVKQCMIYDNSQHNI